MTLHHDFRKTLSTKDIKGYEQGHTQNKRDWFPILYMKGSNRYLENKGDSGTRM